MRHADTDLQVARRQAAQAQARLQRQQALVDALTREGVDAFRARRELAELRLVAELLQDRVTHLEAACRAMPDAFVPSRMDRPAPRDAVGHG